MAIIQNDKGTTDTSTGGVIQTVQADDISPTSSVTVPTPDAVAPKINDQIVASAGLQSETIKAEQEAIKAERESALSAQTLQARVAGLTDIMQGREKAEEDAGLTEQRLRLADITSQIESREQTLRRDIENTQKSRGLSTTQIDRRVRALNRDAARELADLSVIQSATTRRVDALQTSLDRKYELQLDTIKTQLEFDKMFYQENRQNLTSKQDKAFQLRIASEQRLYEEQKEQKSAIRNIALSAAQYGATPEQILAISNAKDFEEATNIGGFFLGEPFRAQVQAQEFAQKVEMERLGIAKADLGLRRQELNMNLLLKEAQIDEIRNQIANSERGNKPLTAGQYQALGYGERMLEASSVVDEVGGKFTGILSKFTGSRFLPTGLKSSDRQRFEQAQRNFVNAVLRRESGSAISDSEFTSAKLQYFPQPGDSEAVLIQKKTNRDMVTRSLLREAGIDTTPQDQSLADPLGLNIKSNNPLEL
jgi:hypothetical protein